MDALISPALGQRALAAYFRSAKDGETLDQPSGNGTTTYTLDDGRTYVVLRNGRGVLAVYRVRNDDMLKRLKRWPAELNDE